MNHLPVAGAVVALCLSLGVPEAQAGSARYQCDGGLILQADLTPRAGRVQAGRTWWAVKRLREPTVRYRDAKKMVTLAVMGRRATWQEGDGAVLNCELLLPEFVHKL